uniref:Uncharacterized protein n=1 Tax=Arundo donax TaxID=35708 RepID=A0A0A9EN79_ARUDO
MCFFFFSD